MGGTARVVRRHIPSRQVSFGSRKPRLRDLDSPWTWCLGLEHHVRVEGVWVSVGGLWVRGHDDRMIRGDQSSIDRRWSSRLQCRSE
ncbi:hypothetical protein AG1IA_07559 [Rhizoctonia solani AG-1 IA]|uniref:Uncharacterized protein n=1 Tax=Thanatephorus cucumeris (strain AG1-IA) TaxID=983506 RepID=L8WPZ6_THACA|nr:hypothetical protein AG1IA_07559 [Rhizoctonia solani AG-1 IA]